MNSNSRTCKASVDGKSPCRTTRRVTMPKMADFAQWGVAVEEAAGLRGGEFMGAYEGNRRAGNELVLESSPVARVLLAMMEKRAVWNGTATDLLEELSALAGEKTCKQQGWPKVARGLSGILRRLAPNLRRAGIDVDCDGHTGCGRSKRRCITIGRSGESSVPSDPSAPRPQNTAVCGDDGGAIAGCGDARGRKGPMT